MKKYKNKIWIAVLALLILIVGFSVFAGAASEGCNVIIDSNKVVFDADSGVPFIDANNRTLVPLRKTMETYGCDVGWDQATRTASVKMDDTTVLVGIGNSYITVNGEKVAIDTAAQIVNSRTYLPIRAVLEAFGAEVGWVNKTRTVLVISPDFAAKEPEIIPPVSEVNVELYHHIELPIKSTASVPVDLYYAFEDGSISTGRIFHVDTYEYVMRIDGYKPGSTTLRLYYSDPDYPQYTDSVTIKINVTNSTKKLQALPGYPNIPDVGKYCDLKHVRTDEDSVVKLYEYDLSTYDKEEFGPDIFVVNNIILNNAGFEMYDVEEDNSGNIAGYYYINNNTGEKLFVMSSYLANGNRSFDVAVFK